MHAPLESVATKASKLVLMIHSAAAKSLQSCLTLCDPIDGSPPGSPVPGILQARALVWVAISFCNAWKWKVKARSLSRVRLFATPWTEAHQAPLSMGWSRQDYWSMLPFPGDLPNQGRNLKSAFQSDSLLSETQGKTRVWKKWEKRDFVNWNLLFTIVTGSSVQFSSVQSLSRVRLMMTPWTVPCQASLCINNSQSPPKLLSIESVMPSSHLILCRPLLLLPSIFPSIRVFSNELAFPIR